MYHNSHSSSEIITFPIFSSDILTSQINSSSTIIHPGIAIEGEADGDIDPLGDMDWLPDGLNDGETLRLIDGDMLGLILGEIEGEILGLIEGDTEGDSDALALITSEGLIEGDSLGLIDGDTDGEIDGEMLGDPLGEILGDTLGLIDNDSLGEGDTLDRKSVV